MTGHPADDVARSRPLVKALREHVDAVGESLTGLPRAQRRPVAVAWVYSTVLIAWAQDHGLVPMWLRPEAEPARKEHLAGGESMASWLARAFESFTVHPATACLFDPRYNPVGVATPSEDALHALVDWWAEAPDLDYEHDGSGPASITGWEIGDLLQAVSDERRKGHAFAQTPWWVADFLCERTLVPAAAEFAGTPLRVIDPACGTGHILTWVAMGLRQLYTEGHPGWPAVKPETAVRRILAGLHGVELDPLTAAVSRLRLTVLAGAFLVDAGVIPGPLRLDRIPTWVRPRVAVGNALLAGMGDPNPPGTILDDTADYPGILERGTYHAVIANPPYITVKDSVANAAIRAAYPEVCSGQYSIAVPFTVLLFELAIRGEARETVAKLAAEYEQGSLFEHFPSDLAEEASA